jgi:signal peptidase II
MSQNVQDAGTDLAQSELLKIMTKFVQGVLKISKIMESKETLYKNLSYLLIPLLVLIDFLIKDFSVKYLEFGVSVSFIPLIDLLLIYNSGIAFGMFDLDERIFSNIIFVIGLFIVIYLFKLMKDENTLLRKYSFALIVGGALGNLIDRIPDGQVTDMFHFHTSNFSFFVFNPADAFISVGAVLIIYSELFYKNEITK